MYPYYCCNYLFILLLHLYFDFLFTCILCFTQLDTESPLDDSPEVDMHPDVEEVDALRGRYIHMLNSVLIHHIPAFWRLSLSVFSGKFAKVCLCIIHLFLL